MRPCFSIYQLSLVRNSVSQFAALSKWCNHWTIDCWLIRKDGWKSRLLLYWLEVRCIHLIQYQIYIYICIIYREMIKQFTCKYCLVHCLWKFRPTVECKLIRHFIHLRNIFVRNHDGNCLLMLKNVFLFPLDEPIRWYGTDFNNRWHDLSQDLANYRTFEIGVCEICEINRLIGDWNNLGSLMCDENYCGLCPRSLWCW